MLNALLKRIIAKVVLKEGISGLIKVLASFNALLKSMFSQIMIHTFVRIAIAAALHVRMLGQINAYLVTRQRH